MTGIERLRASFADPPEDARPLTRWWWFGPEVDRAELTRELEAMRRAGLGGVEVAVVYPLGESPNPYPGKEFLADLRFAAEEARRLGLRFDLTLGSGWSYGGGHITPELAARRLHWDRRAIGLEPLEISSPRGFPGDELIAAYVCDGAPGERSGAYEHLPVDESRGTIRVPDGRGPRTLLVATSRPTGQQVKRAAHGAEGPVLDHYSAAAIARHLEAVADPLLRSVSADLVTDVFCDSLEVYGADWTPRLPEEFRARRGYELIPLLWLAYEDDPRAGALRADYHRTLTELCERNFVEPLRSWAAAHDVRLRIQAYGEPPAAISTFRHADVVEGEGWGWKDLPPTRWASSAAALHGRRIVSSEAWTFVHSPPLRATPLDLQAEAHEHFLCGVNQLIGHGWPYVAPHLDGVGWLFYAAGALDDRNPWWPAAGPLNRYLQRLCWLLRQGERVADVAIYAPLRDIRAAIGGPAGEGAGRALDLWARTRDHIGFDVFAAVREAGFDFDVVDDDALAALDPARYPIVVLPRTGEPTPAAQAWLSGVRRSGGAVLPVGSGAQLAAALAEHEPDVAIRCADLAGTVGVTHRRLGDLDVYLVANTGNQVVRPTLTLRGRDGRGLERWDATGGEVVERFGADEPIALTLAAYEATVLVAHHDTGGEPPTAREPNPAPTARALELAAGWTVRFEHEENAEPVRLPYRWESDPERATYSGRATYTAAVRLSDDPCAVPTEAWLDLGDPTPIDTGYAAPLGAMRTVRGPAYRAEIRPPVGEIAEVFVNGRPVGVLWAPPYRIRIDAQLRPGDNLLELVVANTAANALSVAPDVPRWVAESERRYGHRFTLQGLGSATADVNSGLLAVPRLLIGDPGPVEAASGHGR